MLLSKSQLLCICIYHNTLIIHYALYKNSNYNIIEKKSFCSYSDMFTEKHCPMSPDK